MDAIVAARVMKARTLVIVSPTGGRLDSLDKGKILRIVNKILSDGFQKLVEF